MCKCWRLSLKYPLHERATILVRSPFYHVVKHESSRWSFIACEGCKYGEFRVHLFCLNFNLNYFFGESVNPLNFSKILVTIGQTT